MKRLFLIGWGFLLGSCPFFVFPGHLSAEVKPCPLFSDNAVMLRDTPVPVWGTADPGEGITVSLGNQQAKTTADKDGAWMVRLKPMPAGAGPYQMVIKGKNEVVIQNVVIGEVWHASGQSNMAFGLANCINGKEEISQADYPLIRFFNVKQQGATTPQKDIPVGPQWGRWIVCSPGTAGGLSGVSYFFARELLKHLNVPIGLIETHWAGSPIEPYMSLESLQSDPDFKPILDELQEGLARYPEELARYEPLKKEWDKKFNEWLRETAPLRKEGKPLPAAPARPRPPIGLPEERWATGLYNAMIHPLMPYAIRGVIWYQGESNVSRAYLYRKLFPAMIADWRKNWGQGDFPFLYVQLANYTERQTRPVEPGAWPELQEAQLLALSVPNTAMVVTNDVGDNEEKREIHPPDKAPVGYRLALAARALAYKEPVVYSGPLYDSMKVEADKVRIRFRHVGAGLVSKDGGPLKGFALAGEDRKFYWAEAKIEGGSVVVWSREVSKPVAVRYAWAANPVCNLYNKEGLPASIFRTDDWPLISQSAR